MELIDAVTDFSIEKDIVRPEYDVEFRISEDREVFAWGRNEQFNYELVPYQVYSALCCVAYCNEIPINMKQLTEYSINHSPYRGDIAIAYTVWNCSDTKGSGRSLILALQKHFSSHAKGNRLVTLSPLTEMAKRFHLSNGARLLSTNPESYNFEYGI